MMKFINKLDTGLWLLLLLWCFSIMFWIEADSYTHDLFTRGDTAWFMGAGRAVAKGLVPYVDFSDSKGLLLWWIYALGYWINDYTYIGVFWISVMFSWGTFIYSYKTAMLLSENNRTLSLLATLLMSFPFYNSLIHGRFMEFRCEDFCLLFISWGVYYLINEVKKRESSISFKPGFMLGVGLVACIMIKWSIGVMYLAIVGAYCYLLIKHKSFKGLIGGLFGVFMSSIPFIIAFIYYGNLGPFIQEYFLNTSKTVSQPLGTMLCAYLTEELKRLFTSQSIISLFWIISALIYAHKHKHCLIPVLSGLFILLLAAKHDLGYYTIVIAPYAIFVCVAIASWIKNHCNVVLKYPFLFGLVWWLFNTIPNFIRNEGMWYNSDRELFYKTSYMIGQIKNVRIINESTVGDPVGSIPGSKYWLAQFGETPEMRNLRNRDIHDGNADVIFGNVDALVNKKIFQKYTICDDKGKSISFWGRKGLKYPPKDFYVSDMDILLKKRVINIEKQKYNEL